MKVLLLGEYSGFQTNLKKGLLELGVECVLASDSDGWKKIEGSDFCLFRRDNKNLLLKVWNTIITPYLKKHRFKGYDIVQYVGPYVFHPLINKEIFKYVKHNNRKVFISVAGNCNSLYNSWKSRQLGYYIYDNNPELCKTFNTNSFTAKLKRKNENYLYANVDGIIPIMYEYAVGVRNRTNCLPTIPLPFDCSSVEYTPNIVKDKIVIMHGVIREKYKGTYYIKEALKIIKERYPNDVEIIIDGKKPLKEYLNILQRTNILIDQCKEHCYGMNALYAMAQGKIVLGGASYSSLKELGLESAPVFHIKPNINQIVEQLEQIIKRKNEFKQLGWESRKFVEQFHDCKKIAQQYLNEWNSISK